MTLFSQEDKPGYNHKALFSRLVISCSIILTVENFGDDFIFVSIYAREFTQK